MYYFFTEVMMKLKVTLLLAMAIASGIPANAMLSRLSRTHSKRLIAAPIMHIAQQKRLLYSPCKLKGISALFPAEKQHLSPAYGAPFAHSRYLRNLYAVGNEKNPLVQLAKDPKIGLFYKQGEQFRPTQLKSNPAYALTPTILGHLIGAIETKKIDKKETQDAVITLWRAEHKKLCDGYANNVEKYTAFFNKLCQAINTNESQVRSLLLGFLNHKAQTKQDMIEYRKALALYIPLPSIKESQEFSEDNFTAKDRLIQVGTIDLPTISLSDFEKALFTLAERQTLQAPYPAQVVQGHFSFKGQSMVPNCVEATFLDAYNIMLYNTTDEKFDLSLLPASIKPRPEFINFYQNTCTPQTINEPASTLGFINMVSGLKGKEIVYSFGQNYELDITPENFLHVTNYLFNLSAKNYDELGSLLSDSRRKVTFTLSTQGTITSIAMEIVDNNTHLVKYATIVLVASHGDLAQDHAGLEVPARINALANDPSTYSLWQKIAQCNDQATFNKERSLAPLIAPSESKFLTEIIHDSQVLHNALFSLPLNNPHEVQVVIARLINHYLDKPAWKAIEEDCQALLTRLDSFASNGSIKDMLSKIISSKAYARSTPFLKYCLKHSSEALVACTIREDVDLLTILLENNAFEKAKDSDKECLLAYAATANNTQILEKILKHVAAKEKIQSDFSLVYLAVNRNKPNNLKLLLEHGFDCNGQAINGETPIQRAIVNVRLECIKLLLVHGADYKKQNKYGISGLSIALTQKKELGYSSALDLIEQHQATQNKK